MNYVITIGREYGSFGRLIGKKIADSLHYNFYDNELIAKASLSSGIAKTAFGDYNLKANSFVDAKSGIVSEQAFLAQSEVIKEIAKTENAVIVGRCADYVLKDMPNVISVFIWAPLEYRMEQAILNYGAFEFSVKETVLHMDKARRDYYNNYASGNWGDAKQYDLCINSKCGIETCKNTIIAYLKGKMNCNE